MAPPHSVKVLQGQKLGFHQCQVGRIQLAHSTLDPKHPYKGQPPKHHETIVCVLSSSSLVSADHVISAYR